MKRFGLFLLAVVLVAGLAGCSGEGDDPDSDLNGSTSATKMEAGAEQRIYPEQIQSGSAVVREVEIGFW